jgi:hypothetical protein
VRILSVPCVVRHTRAGGSPPRAQRRARQPLSRRGRRPSRQSPARQSPPLLKSSTAARRWPGRRRSHAAPRPTPSCGPRASSSCIPWVWCSFSSHRPADRGWWQDRARRYACAAAASAPTSRRAASRSLGGSWAPPPSRPCTSARRRRRRRMPAAAATAATWWALPACLPACLLCAGRPSVVVAAGLLLRVVASVGCVCPAWVPSNQSPSSWIVCRRHDVIGRGRL